jgi:hypothetical protein
MIELTLQEIEVIRTDPTNERWWWFPYNRIISEDILREFSCPNTFSWIGIAVYQKLSEDFIREFQHLMSWKYICLHQVFSKEFIIEFIDKIDFKEMFYNEKLPQEIKDYCRMFI